MVLRGHRVKQELKKRSKRARKEFIKQTLFRKEFSGCGLLFSKLFDKLPFELHLPGYQFCGPGTNLAQRLKENQVGINKLDAHCKQHDIAYDKSSDLQDRHIADKLLEQQSLKRAFARDSKLSERLAALLVSGAMRMKRKIGFGADVGKISRILNTSSNLKMNLRKRRKTRTNNKQKKKKKSRKLPLTLHRMVSEISKKLHHSHNGANKQSKKKHKTGSFEPTKGTSNAELNTDNLAIKAVGVAKRVLTTNKFKKGKYRVLPLPKTGRGAISLLSLVSAIATISGLSATASNIASLVQKIRDAITNMKKEKGSSSAIGSKSEENVGYGLSVLKEKNGYGLKVEKCCQIGGGLFVNPYRSEAHETRKKDEIRANLLKN